MNAVIIPAPPYLDACLRNDISFVKAMSLSLEDRARVFALCVVSMSANAPQWVELCEKWGFDLDAPPPVAAYNKPNNWLWHALALNKRSQAIALIEAGARTQEVDSCGRSGLGVFIEHATSYNMECIWQLLEKMESCGMPWDSWPDSGAFDALVISRTGSCISQVLAGRRQMEIASKTSICNSRISPVRI